ncbi:Oxidoreductase UcpA [BD1-7 clade bacterium]|uniref:Oxidoreductase UcpA n=1 Tax=BD1-7 clade bacterium TaxID=2029982 RepID=A0A5S9QN18_9GAMM|nr:Oxidoreductase UcpA [BD1-7 clade bacterium]CAA0120932.1 Oxidoreductase UcpA [BD1-7 clade bacterium]
MKKALITGAAGGLGFATAELLVANGWHVYIADFDAKALSKLEEQQGFTPVVLDVTDSASIDNACEIVGETTDSLDAIINFAGILAVGSVIELDDAVLERVINVNVLGTFRVNKRFFSMLLKTKGKIVNISSETGWQTAAPFNGAYAMSKHAVEAYSDALRREMALLGVDVIKIQPGPFKTAMVSSIESNFSAAADRSQYFGDVIRRMMGFAVKEGKKGNPPEVLAKAVLDALNAKSPKPAYSVKADPARSALEFLPMTWSDWLMKKVLGG